MEIKHQQQAGIEIFRLTGTLAQAAAIEAKHAIFPHISSPQVNKVLINLKEVPFMDSSGIGLMVSFLNMMRDRKGKLALSNLGGGVMDIMKTTRLDTIFTIYPTEEEALSNF